MAGPFPPFKPFHLRIGISVVNFLLAAVFFWTKYSQGIGSSRHYIAGFHRFLTKCSVADGYDLGVPDNKESPVFSLWTSPEKKVSRLFGERRVLVSQAPRERKILKAKKGFSKSVVQSLRDRRRTLGNAGKALPEVGRCVRGEPAGLQREILLKKVRHGCDTKRLRLTVERNVGNTSGNAPRRTIAQAPAGLKKSGLLVAPQLFQRWGSDHPSQPAYPSIRPCFGATLHSCAVGSNDLDVLRV